MSILSGVSWFLHLGPNLGAYFRHRMLTTDASLMGWGAVLEAVQPEASGEAVILISISTALNSWLYL